MERKEEIAKLCKDRAEAADLVEEILFLESKLTELKKLPFYKVHPTDNCKQKVLPAAKLYKELLQQYTNCLKLLLNFDASRCSKSCLYHSSFVIRLHFHYPFTIGEITGLPSLSKSGVNPPEYPAA